MSMLIERVLKHKKRIALLVAIIVGVFLPMVVTSPYYLDILVTTIMFAILSMAFVMMFRTGLISLGTAAFWGVGAYASAALTVKLGLSFWIALPLSGVAAGVVAFFLGFVLIGRSSGLSFVILTAVIGMLFTATIGAIDYLGGYSGISDIPAPGSIRLPGLTVDFGSKASYYYLALFLLLVVALICTAVYRSWIGRAWTAVGLNPRLAQSIGVDLFRYQLLSFVVASGIAGLVGSFYAHYVGTIVPDTFNTWQNVYIQLYAILGGIHSAIIGPLVGAAIMKFLPESLRFMSLYAPLVTGALLILLVLFLPSGLLGLITGKAGRVGRLKENLKTVRAFVRPRGAEDD
jgi:branched-chain amino acid transport system permease protein